MDITKILNDIKGKVLDAAHFDMLKRAYDLQQENIAQLKENNELLREANQRLKGENETLKTTNADLVAKLKTLSHTHPGEFTQVASDVLNLFLHQDTTSIHDEAIVNSLSHGRIKVEAALDELRKANILRREGNLLYEGFIYYLTETGKQYLAKLGK